VWTFSLPGEVALYARFADMVVTCESRRALQSDSAFSQSPFFFLSYFQPQPPTAFSSPPSSSATSLPRGYSERNIPSGARHGELQPRTTF
jgi:hypothetical protein